MSIRNSGFWIAACICLALDQLTKYWTVQALDVGETIPLWQGVFHFTFVTNSGAAFSILQGQVELLRWFSLTVSLGLIALACFGGVMNRWEQIGFGCILGGALGNGIDRFAAGEVVDFLDFRLIHFPVFNLADVSINVGIICLLIALFIYPSDPNGSGRKRGSGDRPRKRSIPR